MNVLGESRKCEQMGINQVSFHLPLLQPASHGMFWFETEQRMGARFYHTPEPSVSYIAGAYILLQVKGQHQGTKQMPVSGNQRARPGVKCRTKDIRLTIHPLFSLQQSVSILTLNPSCIIDYAREQGVAFLESNMRHIEIVSSQDDGVGKHCAYVPSRPYQILGFFG